jgi:hypothetical protein
MVEGSKIFSYKAVRGYGMLCSQVGKTIKVCKQSVLRAVEQGKKQYHPRRWGLKDSIVTELSELRPRPHKLKPGTFCQKRKGRRRLLAGG